MSRKPKEDPDRDDTPISPALAAALKWEKEALERQARLDWELTRAAQVLRDRARIDADTGLEYAAELGEEMANLLDAIADLAEHTESGLLHNVPKTIVEIATVVVTARDGVAAAILREES
jgi:hypothetical protein